MKRRAMLMGSAAIATGGWTRGSPLTVDVITPTNLALSSTVNVSFTGVVCRFICSNASLGATDFSAVIDWGDGTAATAGTIAGPSPFSVSGTHVYGIATPRTVSIRIAEIASPAISGTANSTMTVSPGTPDTITGHDLVITATTGVPYAAATGTFTCSNMAITAAQLTSTINWGDGTNGPGTITGSNGSFTVVGATAHTYAAAGSFTTTTELHITASPTVSGTAHGTVTVSNPAPVGTFTATITLAGVPYVFSSAGATDMGDYVDPQGRFTQKCLGARNAALPYFFVMFRPDVAGGRLEVVFELGKCFGIPGGFFQNMNPYSVVIAKDGVTVTTISCPLHWWWSRWRYQSAPRPVTVTPASLMSSGFIPPMASSVSGGFALTWGQSGGGYATWAGPMDFAGIPIAMISGGDSPELGPMTAYDSEYAILGNSEALQTVIARTDGSASLSMHMRDENTGGPLDLNTYTDATTRGSFGNPLLANDQNINPNSFINPTHQPALGYFHFLITGDPFALEELQFLANMNMVFQAPGDGRQDYWQSQSIRGTAWAFRTMGQATKASPDIAPSWLKPKAYWKSFQDGARDYAIANWANNPSAPYASLFIAQNGAGAREIPEPNGTIPANCSMAGFQEDYLQVVFGWLVAIGFSDWLPALAWHTSWPIGRTSATSGWNRGEPALYIVAIRIDEASPYFGSFGAFYNYNLQIGSISPAPAGPDHLINPAYFPYDAIVYAGLALARRANIPGASTALNWFYPELQSQFDSVSQFIQAKWSFV